MVDWCSAVIRLCLSNSLSPSVFFNSDSLVDGFLQGTEIPMSRTGEKRRVPRTQVAPRTHTEVRRRPEKLGEHPGTKGLLVALFQELQSFLNGKHHLHLLYQGGIVSIYPADRLSPEALDQPKPLSLIPGTISYAWLTLCSDIQ